MSFYAGYVKMMLKVDFSEVGTLQREKEEMCYIHFMDECEGMFIFM